MGETLNCDHLKISINSMPKGSLFVVTCSKYLEGNFKPTARTCTKCIIRGENKL